jgi:HAD superfamily hydrolase (TIGR01490 family)
LIVLYFYPKNFTSGCTLEAKRFQKDYLNGCLNIFKYMEFSLRPLAEHNLDQLCKWRSEFMATCIQPVLLSSAKHLIDKHKSMGDRVVIITNTNYFVTKPIAEAYGVEHLIATVPEFKEGRYTGRCFGTPCFQDGKVTRLITWLKEEHFDLKGSWFYSDSHNDIPLLLRVENPVAVDPDAHLALYAKGKNWPIISLRNKIDAKCDG